MVDVTLAISLSGIAYTMYSLVVSIKCIGG